MIAGTLEIQLMANMAKLSKDMGQAKELVTKSMRGVEEAVSSAKAALASLGIGVGFAGLVALTDQYTKYTAQLKLATDSMRQLAIAQADVRRISTLAQADLQATGVLYARITNATKELGLSQSNVARLTETVSLALKASGATTAEAASAMLQLSQAFGSGVLRGQEFNAVNEAAPRLMKALAEGIGVPVGALRGMAEQGLLTAEVMANALPKSLEALRGEASQVQTIAGAWQVLKNNVMEFVGTANTSNGAIQAVTSAITLLANNLQSVMTLIFTITAAKFGQWFYDTAAAIYAKVSAIVASTAAAQNEAAANLASAKFEIDRQRATLASLPALREKALAELNAAHATIRATEGIGVQSAALAANTAAKQAAVVATTQLAGISQVQAHATTQLNAALAAQTAAQTAAAASATGLLSRAIGLLGGPIGAIITVLGVAATLWTLFGDSAKQANEKAAQSTSASTIEIIREVEKQNEKLRERLVLMKAAGDIAKQDSPAVQEAARLQGIVNTLMLKQSELKAIGVRLSREEQFELDFAKQKLEEIVVQLNRQNKIKKEIEVGNPKAADWMKDYATNAEKLAAELAKARKELGDAFTPELERRIREKFASQDKAAKAFAKEEEKYQKEYIDGWVKSIDAQTEEYEAGLKADAKALDEWRKHEDKMLKLSNEGWIKKIEADIEEYEDGLKIMAAKQPSFIQAQEKAWKPFMDSIESGWRDMWTGVMDGTINSFEDVTKRLGSMFIKLLTDLAYQALIKPIMINFAGGIANMFGMSGLAGAANTALGAGQQAGFGNILSLFGLGGSSAGGTTAAGASAGASGSGGLSSLAAAFAKIPMWGWIGAAIVAGMATSAKLFDKGFTRQSAGSGVLQSTNPEFLADKFLTRLGVSPRMAAILTGSAITARVFRALGMGGENWRATLGFGSNAQAYANTGGVFGAEGFKQIAGNDENNRNIQNWMAGIAKEFDARLATRLSASQIAGISTTLQNSPQREFAFGSGDKTSGAQITLEYLQKKYGTIFDEIDKTFADFIRNYTGSSEDLAKEIDTFITFMDQVGKLGIVGLDTNALREVQLEGEKLSDTLVRVLSVFEATSMLTDQAFGAIGMASYEARQQLIDFAGGIEAFTAAQNSFYENFYSQEERDVMLKKQLTEQFEKMGLKLPETREAYRALVEAQDLSTEEGREMYAFLISLGPAFASLVPAIQDVGTAVEETVQKIAGISVGEIQDWATTQFTALQNRINTLFSGVGIEEKTAGALNIIDADIQRYQNQLAQAFLQSGGAGNSTTLGLQQLITQLQAEKNRMAGDLAQYLIFNAQHPGKGQALLEVEKWYAEMKGLFANNSAALLEIEALYAKKRQDIITGSGQETVNKLAEYLRGSLLNERLSPLTLQQRFGAAQSEYQRLLGLAPTDAAARDALGGARDTMLELARQMWGSSGMYNALWQTSFDQIKALAGAGAPSWQTAFQSALPPTGQSMASETGLRRIEESVNNLIGLFSSGTVTMQDPEAVAVLDEIRMNLETEKETPL